MIINLNNMNILTPTIMIKIKWKKSQILIKNISRKRIGKFNKKMNQSRKLLFPTNLQNLEMEKNNNKQRKSNNNKKNIKNNHLINLILINQKYFMQIKKRN